MLGGIPIGKLFEYQLETALKELSEAEAATAKANTEGNQDNITQCIEAEYEALQNVKTFLQKELIILTNN